MGFRWERNSLSNCSANQSVNVDYNLTNERLQITPLANASGVNINGLSSKFAMNFQDGFTQVEVPTIASDSVTELAAGTDCNNWYRIYRKNSELIFQSKSGGVQTNIASITYNFELHRYWRIRHNPTTNTILFETGEIVTNIVPDPNNPPQTFPKEKKLVWIQRAETSVNFSLAQVRFEIVGGTDSAVTSPNQIVFDNFLFNSNNSEVTPPQQTVDTNYPTNLDGIVRNVTECNQIQSTLNAAQPGDTVSLSPSLTCIGNYTLPTKNNPNNKWIVVRSASTDFDSGGFIRAGRRINGENPAHIAQVPKLYTNNSASVLEVAEGANYYRIVGIEIGTDPNCSSNCNDINSALVALPDSTTQSHHIIIDRCYIHGRLTPSSPNIKRAIALHGNNLAVIDSYISKIIARPLTFQNQAIGMWSGSGPIKIENNYLEALAQNILIGGASPANGETISDIVIRRNYFYKSDALYREFGCNTDFTSCPNFPPTNGIEIKRGRRVQVTDNFFEQTLAGVFIKVTADSGCINCISEQINVENNKFKNVRFAFDAVPTEGSSTGGNPGTVQNPNHITVKNNLSYFTDISNAFTKGYIGSSGFKGRNDIPDFKLIHNTYESEFSFWSTTIPSNMFNFEMRDNIFERRFYGLGGFEGTDQLNLTLFPYKFRKNVLVNNSDSTNQNFSDSYFVRRYPCTSLDSFCNEYGTFIVSAWDSADSDGDDVGFQESSLALRRNAGNYRLSTNSAYRNAGTDGTDIGVNQNILDAATSGVITGVWETQTSYPSQTPPSILTTLEVENFDNGGQGIAYNDTFGNTSSSFYRSNPVETVDVLANSNASNGFAVFEAAAGEWLEYTVNVPASGLYNFGVKYSSGYSQPFSQGQFKIEVCEPTANGGVTNCVSSQNIRVNSTGGWNSFQSVKAPIYLPSSGTRILRLIMVTNAPGDTNCNCVVANFDAITVSNQRTLFDYDNDRKADISVFRPSNSTWYLQQSTTGFSAVTFGVSTDIVTPADFDGDGKTDVAVWRPSTGVWSILNSSNSSVTIVTFGANGDIPVQADYDGDGKADIAVWRPSDGVWYRLNSSDNSFFTSAFGTNGDKPTVGDYDGDGKFDLAIFRPSNGTWYLQQSIAGFSSTQFGQTSDQVTPVDYDGDGKTDIAVFRLSDSTWYRLNSGNGQFVGFQFGVSGDIPSPADFDGDGKMDIATFRPSTGIWYIQQTTVGFTSQAFGLNGDIPTPSTYVR